VRNAESPLRSFLRIHKLSPLSSLLSPQLSTLHPSLDVEAFSSQADNALVLSSAGYSPLVSVVSSTILSAFSNWTGVPLELTLVTSRPSQRAVQLISGLSNLVLGLVLPHSLSAPLSKLLPTFIGSSTSLFLTRRSLQGLLSGLTKHIFSTVTFLVPTFIGCSYSTSKCEVAVVLTCRTHQVAAPGNVCSVGKGSRHCVIYARSAECIKHKTAEIAPDSNNVYKCRLRTFVCKKHKTSMTCNDPPTSCYQASPVERRMTFTSRAEALAFANLPDTPAVTAEYIREMCEPPTRIHAFLYWFNDRVNLISSWAEQHPRFLAPLMDLPFSAMLVLAEQDELTWSDFLENPRFLFENPAPVSSWLDLARDPRRLV